MIINRLKSLFNPEQYHGWGKKKRFFEGWYYKIVDAEEKKTFAIIPGIAMDNNGGRQSFVQVLDGINKTAEYHKFDSAEFVAQPGRFNINVANNTFSNNKLKLDLPEVSLHLTFQK